MESFNVTDEYCGYILSKNNNIHELTSDDYDFINLKEMDKSYVIRNVIFAIWDLTDKKMISLEKLKLGEFTYDVLNYYLKKDKVFLEYGASDELLSLWNNCNETMIEIKKDSKDNKVDFDEIFKLLTNVSILYTNVGLFLENAEAEEKSKKKSDIKVPYVTCDINLDYVISVLTDSIIDKSKGIDKETAIEIKKLLAFGISGIGFAKVGADLVGKGFDKAHKKIIDVLASREKSYLRYYTYMMIATYVRNEEIKKEFGYHE